MKYIRFKDTILYNIADGVFPAKTLFGENLLEEADTIEDLLDEIVFIHGDDVSVDYELLTPEQYEKYYKGEDYCCKGAIWTDKGLIFVSEMNTETGEMELL